jgi:putative protease
VDELIECALAARAGGLEVHSAGVLHRLSERQDVHGLTVVAGGFTNIYTRRTAALYAEKGATLLVPNYELPWEAVESIQKGSHVPLEMLVHGKIPLGLSDACLLVERSADLGTKCPDSCLSDLWLEFHKWSLRSLGKLTASGRDLCLLPEMPFFWAKGLRDYRIAGLAEKPETLNEVGRAYRAALARLQETGKANETVPDALKAASRYGLCNGYLYGRSGCDWVEQHLSAV